jgi:hypothetical protein
MFPGWDNYFFLTGSAAAGLIGLLFVVVTLTAGVDRTRAIRGAALYMTPTMVQFLAVFTISAVAVAPHLSPIWVAGLSAAITLLGLVNAVRATLGIARPQTSLPTPHWSDLWCYGAGPALLYLALLVACLEVSRQVEGAPATLAGRMLALLLLAIRNAWDLVTSLAPTGPSAAGSPPQP